MTSEFARLVLDPRGRLTARGPYPDTTADEHADDLYDRLEAVWVSRPIALTPVTARPLTAAATYSADGVVQVPPELVEALTGTASPPVPAGRAVVLVVCGEAPHPGVIVGPFTARGEADDWIGTINSSTGLHPATCHIIALEPAGR